ncbi:hypothetical protein BU16DRAFT_524650 [Lophium mytilinum]|uniref:DNA helicase n=1 Tax=Lophium mytilinum TaxID=390894 RepID=A0A6A6R2Q0_9PEZI|nr:hypothetical protein BU16DRAFT_524650 [Lophium mytilinum]
MGPDPIIDSSPIRLVDPGRRPPATYNSDDDSGDELFEGEDQFTEATMPISSSYFHNRKPNPPTQSTFITQPTQPLTTPKKNTQSVVQVAASSPPLDVSSPSPSTMLPRPNVMAMAPPGTYLRAPFSYNPPSHVPIDSDDPPVEDSSDDEVGMRGDIKASTFRSAKGQSSSSRVEETPQKRAIDFSNYNYGGPLKRKVGDMASAYTAPDRKKLKPQVPSRQTGPSRAQPVQSDMELDDIPDLQVRKKVERLKLTFPTLSIMELQSALALKKGQCDDAMDYILAKQDAILLSEDELTKTPKDAKLLPKGTAQRKLTQPIQSIQQKYSNLSQKVPEVTTAQRKLTQPIQSIQQKYSNLEAEAAAQPKKRRLIQGRRNRTPSPDATGKPRKLPLGKSVLQAEAERQRKKAVVIDSDEEEEAAVSDISDDTASEDEGVSVANNIDLIEFFNKCSVQEMVDLSDQKPDIVEYVLSKRPFRNLRQVEEVTMMSEPSVTAKGKPRKPQAKKVGESLLNFAQQMWDGYSAVDDLVIKCGSLGQPIKQAMQKWGFDIFGASTQGEVALISLDDIKSEASSARDSGIGTPRSPITIDDGEEDDVTQRDRSKSKFLKKPVIMSADIELKDYQLVGLNWLNLLWDHGMSCILADDMGLGKTCQVIAFLSHLKEKGVKGPHLIIVPGAVLENWLREFEKFSPKIVVEPYYGLQKAREEQQYTILDSIDNIDVIVTTYDLCWKASDNKFLRKCQPKVCVFDEGHTLRSPGSKKYAGLMKIPADFRVLLTGTPLQNNLQELAAILAFIMPDLFHAKHEELNFVFKHKAKTTDKEHSALLSEERINRARAMITPFLLRRKKEQTLKHLPKKTNRVEHCELVPEQKKIYDRLLTKQRKVLSDRAAGIENKDHANTMMRLRQAAIHPFLFREIYDDKMIKKIHKTCMKGKWRESDSEIVMEELLQYSDYDFHDFIRKNSNELSKYALTNNEWMNSGKVAKLGELLTKYKENGDRALVFSQFTTVMDILQLVLDTLGIAYMRIDGSTPIPERQTLLDVFTTDTTIPVFLLSTKSGGTGINLTAANKIIIFDSSFNPQEDVQAENRAHRVGQTREVEVVRLVTKGTIEEQIHALGKSKLALDAMVSNGEKGEKEEKDIEKKGLDTVAEMLAKELAKKEGSEDGTVKDEEIKGEEDVDIKEQYLDGLKKHGLDLSAA